jgi:hypothetical protein
MWIHHLLGLAGTGAMLVGFLSFLASIVHSLQKLIASHM